MVFDIVELCFGEARAATAPCQGLRGTQFDRRRDLRVATRRRVGPGRSRSRGQPAPLPPLDVRRPRGVPPAGHPDAGGGALVRSARAATNPLITTCAVVWENSQPKRPSHRAVDDEALRRRRLCWRYSTVISHGVPKRSTTAPNDGDQNVFCSGIRTEPPSASASKTRCASAASRSAAST